MREVIIPDMPELDFDERRHVYRLNGVIIPSVTTLMKPLSNRVYGTIDPAVLDKAARRGTAIHNASENFIQYGVMDVDPEFEGYLEAFRRWWMTKKPKPIATERRVYHKILRYAGTSDLIAEIDGAVTLVDYKTSAQVQEKLCSVQLEGYDRAYETHGVKIENRIILHLSGDGQYQEHRFMRDPKSWSVLSALMTINNYMN